MVIFSPRETCTLIFVLIKLILFMELFVCRFCSWNLLHIDFFSSWKLYIGFCTSWNWFCSWNLLHADFCLWNFLNADFSLFETSTRIFLLETLILAHGTWSILIFLLGTYCLLISFVKLVTCRFVLSWKFSVDFCSRESDFFYGTRTSLYLGDCAKRYETYS